MVQGIPGVVAKERPRPVLAAAADFKYADLYVLNTGAVLECGPHPVLLPNIWSDVVLKGGGLVP